MNRSVSLLLAVIGSMLLVSAALVDIDAAENRPARGTRSVEPAEPRRLPPTTAIGAASKKTRAVAKKTDVGPRTMARPTAPEQPLLTGELTTEMEARRDKIRKTLEIYSHRHMNTVQHSPWEIMHGIIAYGVDTQLRVGGPSGEPTTAVGWLCYNRYGNGLNLFYNTPQGIGALNGPGMQGHSGQFLAMMAQSKVKVDYPMKIGGRDLTLADLVAYEKRTCMPNTELTFKLIGIVHYEGTDAEWMSEYGEPWSVQRLIQQELAQPIRGATCGGTHRLMGFSYALYKRGREGKPITGQFARAHKFTEDYRKYTFKLQNSDGSFSTEWFRGRGARPDIARRMQTTGHILEWMVFALPQEQLTDPKTIAAVDYLTTILYDGQRRQWEVGPLGHALHALALYDRRVFEPAEEEAAAVAAKPDEQDSDAATETK